jgi:uncharacterized membrane protein
MLVTTSIVVYSISFIPSWVFPKNIPNVIVVLLNLITLFKGIRYILDNEGIYKTEKEDIARLFLIIFSNVILGFYFSSNIILIGTLIFPIVRLFKSSTLEDSQY